MADTGIFATTAEVQRKVGANASTTANTEAYINDFMAQAESFINVSCKVNFSDVYDSLNADVKALLKQVASDIAATYVINYDLSTFTSRAEAQTRLDVLRDRISKGIELLKEKDKTDVISEA